MTTTRRLVERAARGDSEAQFRLGYRLAFGKSTKAKPEWRRIVNYWRAAAEAGHVRAQFYLGTCFDWGHGVSRDVAIAMLWYKKAARNGHEVAQYNIAYSYRKGRGVLVHRVFTTEAMGSRTPRVGDVWAGRKQVM